MTTTETITSPTLLKVNYDLERAKPVKTGDEINWKRQNFNTVYIDRKYGEYQLSLLTNQQVLTSSIGEYVTRSGKYTDATKKFLQFAGKLDNFFSSSNPINPVSVREFYFPVRSCSYLQILFSVPISVIESAQIPADPAIQNILTDPTKLENIPVTSRFLYTDSSDTNQLSYEDFTANTSKLLNDLRFISELNTSLTNPIPINLELDTASILSLVAGIQNVLTLNDLPFSQSFGKLVCLLEKNESEDVLISYLNLEDKNKKMSVGVRQFTESFTFNNQNIMYLLYNSKKINEYVNNLTGNNTVSGKAVSQFFTNFYDQRELTEETKQALTDTANSEDQIAIESDASAADGTRSAENCTVQGNIQKLRGQYQNLSSLRNSIRSNVNSTTGNPALEILVGDLKRVNEEENKTLPQRLKEGFSSAGKKVKAGVEQLPPVRAYENFITYQRQEPPELPAPEGETNLQAAKRNLQKTQNEIERIRTTISLGVEIIKSLRIDEILFALYECRLNVSPELVAQILSKYLTAKQKLDKFLNDAVCNKFVNTITKLPQFNVPGGLATSDPLESITKEVAKALGNALIDLILISIRGSIEAFQNNTCDTGNLNNFQDTGTSIGDLTADQEDAVGDILAQNGINRDQLNEFTKFLNDVLCVLRPSEICLLLSGTTLGNEQKLILKSLILNKYPTLSSFIDREDLLLALCKSIIEKLELTNICLDLLNDSLPFNRAFCDISTLNNARRQLLEQKSLTAEQINDLLNAIKSDEEKELENIVKLLNGDVPNSLPNLLCSDNSTKNLLADIVNNNPAYQSIYGSLIKSMVKPLYPVYNQDILEWPTSLVTNEKKVKVKEKNSFIRPELAAINGTKLEDANKKENVKIEKYIAVPFSDVYASSSNTIVTASNYDSKLVISSDKQYELDYGLSRANINYQEYNRLTLELKTAFIEFFVNLASGIANLSSDTIKTATDIVDSSQKIINLEEQGIVGSTANTYDLMADFFNNIDNAEIKRVGGADRLEKAIDSYNTFKSTANNATLNTYAKYEINYQYLLKDRSKDNIVTIKRNELESYFTSSEQHSFTFREPNTDNKQELLNTININSVSLTDLQNLNKQTFSDILKDKTDKNKNYYLKPNPYSTQDLKKYVLAYGEVDKYIKFINDFTGSYEKLYNTNNLRSYVNLRRDYVEGAGDKKFVDLSRFEDLNPIYKQGSDLAIYNNQVGFIGDCIMLVCHAVREFYTKRREEILNIVNNQSQTTEEKLKVFEIINAQNILPDKIRDIVLFKVCGPLEGLDKDSIEKFIIDIYKDQNKTIIYYAYQVLKFGIANNIGLPAPENEYKKVYNISNVINIFNDSKAGFGLRFAENKVIIDVFEKYFYFSFRKDEGSIFEINSSNIFRAGIRPPAPQTLLNQNTQEVDFNKSLIESLLFTEKKDLKDKICDKENSFLGLDKAEQNIKTDKQENICYDSQNNDANFVSEESNMILKEICNIIVRAYVYDFLMQGIVSFYDITPKAIKNDMMLKFMTYKMKVEMSKLSAGYFENFVDKLYELNTGVKNESDNDIKLSILKLKISNEIDNFNTAYFTSKKSILKISPVLNYAQGAETNLTKMKDIYEFLSFKEGEGQTFEIVGIKPFRRYQSFYEDNSNIFGDIDVVFFDKNKFEIIVGFYYKILNLTYLKFKSNDILSNLQTTNASIDFLFNKEDFTSNTIKRVAESGSLQIKDERFSNGTNSESIDNNKFDALIPLKDYHVLSFIAANLSTSVRKKGTSVFRDTHATLLITYNNLISGVNADIPVPLITNSNAPSTVGTFARNALIKTPLMIAKGAVEALDPNVATAKALYQFTKDLRLAIDSNAPENKYLDTLIPAYGASLTFAGIVPTPIGLAYYASTLWSDSLLGGAFEDDEKGNIPITCGDE
jgi:hypothetical protein